MSEGLTPEQIRQVEDRPIKAVACPEWGGTLYIRTLSGLEANQIRDFHKGPNILGCYAALLLCDAEGNRLFTLEDAEWLGEKDSTVLSRICEEGQVFNKLTPEQQEDAGKN